MQVQAVPLRGRLEEHSFAAVLRALLHERRDGCLIIARGAIVRRLYLRGGMIVSASSTGQRYRLGKILVAQGRLSKADHEKYREQSQDGDHQLGIALVVNDCITMGDLYQGVTAQVVAILARLQKWRNGDFEFEEGREPDVGTALLRIPIALYLKGDPRERPAAMSFKPVTGANPEAAAVGDEEVEFEIVDEFAAEEAIDTEAAIEAEAPDDMKGVDEVSSMVREAPSASRAAEEQLRYKASSAAPTAQRLKPIPSENDQSRRFYAQGREWISKRNFWQAADALRQAVRLKPADATYRQYLGLALVQTKRMHEAEEHLVEAVRLEPNNPVHLVNLGRVYRSGRLYKKAREAFERAQRIDPHNPQLRDELGELPEEQVPGRKPESGGIFKKFFGKG